MQYKWLPSELTKEMLLAVDSFMTPAAKALYERMWQAATGAEQASVRADWYSVNDKLPPSFVQVLVLDSKEGYFVAMYSTESSQWFGADNYHLYDVTRWTPIPEYEEQKR
jgi:hypothetical protein